MNKLSCFKKNLQSSCHHVLYNTDFQDLALSTSKRAAPQTWYQYNTKFEKKNVFINVLIRLLLKTL